MGEPLARPRRAGPAALWHGARAAVVLGLAVLLGACASPGLPPPGMPAAAPPQWQLGAPATPSADAAPLPHGGSLQDLLAWWRGLGEPLLVDLIEAGQRVSPTVASARARLAQARAERVAAGAALVPSVDAAASLTRSRSLRPGAGPAINATVGQLGLQTAWEIDLFGGLRAERDAAQERLQGAQADWHEARVSVAAEVAVQYELLRQCRQRAQITRRDADSRAQTARLTELSSQAGLGAPAAAALARAGAAESHNRALQQAAQCELEIKALVALTGMPEPQLRSRLDTEPMTPVASLVPLRLDPVPARALAQRPDIFSAERALLAARADIAGAQAQRLPRLALQGFIGGSALRAVGTSVDATTWSLGPLSLSLPVLDAGRRSARVDAALARHEEAAAQYAARVRQAVREVESAWIDLQSTAERGPQVEAAVAGYRQSLQATQARHGAGLASLLELEEARRQLLAAEIARADWRTQARAAHVSLYRAVGGGWSPALLQDPAALR